MATERIILAIETAVGRGSIALVRGQDVIAESGPDVARADLVLQGIDSMFEQAGITLQDIDKIAVSVGPGSFTGIRIGISTALGLRRALNFAAVGVSLFRAVASVSKEKNVAAIIPIGRSRFGCQIFRTEDDGSVLENKPIAFSEGDLGPNLGDSNVECAVFVSPGSNSADLDVQNPSFQTMIVNESDLAAVVGVFASRRESIDPLDPIYLR